MEERTLTDDERTARNSAVALEAAKAFIETINKSDMKDPIDVLNASRDGLASAMASIMKLPGMTRRGAIGTAMEFFTQVMQAASLTYTQELARTIKAEAEIAERINQEAANG